MVWNSSDVIAGQDITAEQYNALRADLAQVLEASVPIGTVIKWAGNSLNVPDGYLVCDGSAINRSSYSSLFTIIGTVFGAGNGSTTFNLPDIRDKFVIGAGNSYSVNAQGGEASHTLSVGEIPSHTHTQNSHNHSQNSHNHSQNPHYHSVRYKGFTNVDAGSVWNFLRRRDGADAYTAEDADAAASTTATNKATTATNNATTATNQNTGGGGAHNNLPPYIGLIYIIKVS